MRSSLINIYEFPFFCVREDVLVKCAFDGRLSGSIGFGYRFNSIGNGEVEGVLLQELIFEYTNLHGKNLQPIALFSERPQITMERNFNIKEGEDLHTITLGIREGKEFIFLAKEATIDSEDRVANIVVDTFADTSSKRFSYISKMPFSGYYNKGKWGGDEEAIYYDFSGLFPPTSQGCGCFEVVIEQID